MNVKLASAFLVTIVGVLGPSCRGSAAEALRAETIDFARQIRPILSDHCFQCHGPDAQTREADLRLDDRASALREQEPVIRPHDAEASVLWQRIISTDADLVMPPPTTGRQLTDAQKSLIHRWIQAGAPWEQHWAFQRPVRPPLPAVQDVGWPHTAVDSFVLHRLEVEQLRPADEAPPAALLRRVTLDITGFPPTLDEVEQFLSDSSPGAYERAVDRLLASPRFGERMIWEWLDAARYADTNGYQGDPTRAMWYWRDWALAALNQGMSFDQFTIEQLAGDLLPDATQDQIVATGFHRNHMINGEGGRIAEESRVDYVQDRVETTGTVWMGLTMNCCRCHDHKFDPLSQREYYQLSAFFNSIDETGAGREAGGLSNPVLELTSAQQRKQLQTLRQVERVAARELANREKQLTDDVVQLLRRPAADRNDIQQQRVAELPAGTEAGYDQLRRAAEEAKKHREQFERSIPRTMVMRERAQPRETRVLIRGAYNQYGEQVTHGVPAVLPRLPSGAGDPPAAEPHPTAPTADIAAPRDGAAHVGQLASPPSRLDLARWLVSPEHPLTARVTVNRYWQSLFGTGLVKTSEDFGSQGEPPSHPELLDWLACEFQQRGWDVKQLIRTFVTSRTYRQSSRATPELWERDPENRLLARSTRMRLPSWMIRDQALAISGLLIEQLGGPPVKGYQPPGIWEEATFGKIQYEQDHGAPLYRRSVYQFWRRIVGPTMFFDVAARQTCQVKVARTNTPLHALTCLNDVTYVEAARALAERLLQSPVGDDQARVELAFLHCTLRTPTEREMATLLSRLQDLRATFGKDEQAARALTAVGESLPNTALAPGELAAWSSLSLLLLNLDETITKE
ncbi:MAG: DUF1553 domain-containing protein [Pirellulaceae bacterium]